MYEMAKTVFKVYGKLEKTAEKIESLILSAALGTFSDRAPCSVSCERMCALVERKNLLVNLKVMTRSAFRSISKEDMQILSYSMGKKMQPLYYSKRTLFRKKQLAFKEFEKQLENQGLTKDVFLSEYVNKIHAIGVAYESVVLNEQKKKERTLQVSKNLNQSKATSNTAFKGQPSGVKEQKKNSVESSPIAFSVNEKVLFESTPQFS